MNPDREQAIKDVAEATRLHPWAIADGLDDTTKGGWIERGLAYAVSQRERVIQLERTLGWFLDDPRFQVVVGGNPNAVTTMLDAARAALEVK